MFSLRPHAELWCQILYQLRSSIWWVVKISRCYPQKNKSIFNFQITRQGQAWLCLFLFLHKISTHNPQPSGIAEIV
jgi:hypothetical protein